jgi:hypothetical protein
MPRQRVPSVGLRSAASDRLKWGCHSASTMERYWHCPFSTNEVLTHPCQSSLKDPRMARKQPIDLDVRCVWTFVSHRTTRGRECQGIYVLASKPLSARYRRPVVLELAEYQPTYRFGTKLPKDESGAQLSVGFSLSQNLDRTDPIS